MSVSEITPDSPPVAELNDSHATVSWATSLCFWAVLLVSAGVYAAVALAPKFCVWNQVRLEYQQNARQLVELETEVSYLERVEAALKTDPEFRRQISSLSRPDSQSEAAAVPVGGALSIAPDVPLLTDRPVEHVPAYHAAALTLATDRSLRITLLCLSAAMTIFAFGVLNEGGTGLVLGTGRLLKAIAQIPLQRYLKSATETRNEGIQRLDDRPGTRSGT
ncbi:MAG: hypothetical protein R3C49_15395 [Planctomycetaceae bacterium]